VCIFTKRSPLSQGGCGLAIESERSRGVIDLFADTADDQSLGDTGRQTLIHTQGLRMRFHSIIGVVVANCLLDCTVALDSDPARLERIQSSEMPDITQPVMFDTPEADAILSSLEVFPPDNAFNQVIEDWPLHPNSRAIVESVGADKPFRYNPDMAFILVPPDLQRIDVRIVEYPDESDAGPYPVP
jgi:hypothetical protein